MNLVENTADKEKQRDYRSIVARWRIEATLTFDSAALLNGIEADNCDLTFAVDENGLPTLYGTTLAGALRSGLSDRLMGYRGLESEEANTLFGDEQSRATAQDARAGKTHQSALIVFDAPATQPARATIRDGVRLEAATGLAREGFKYDREMTLPGLSFPIRVDLIVPETKQEPNQEAETNQENDLLTALCHAFLGVQALGARRSRGLGRVSIANFCAKRFDLTSAAGWRTLASFPDTERLENTKEATLPVALVKECPTLEIAKMQDARQQLTVRLEMQFCGTLLIRTPSQNATSADVIHLTEDGRPLLSGTSFAGLLRSQARRILRTLQASEGTSDTFLDMLFGTAPDLETRPERVEKSPQGSKIWVSETSIEGGRSYRQTRVKIDRLLGGASDTALFEEEPLAGGEAVVDLLVRNPTEAEIGLILLTVRDVLEGLVSLGGEASVGRGMVRGTATITLTDGSACSLDEQADRFVAALLEELRTVQVGGEGK
jgi:CRISPR/Cas system CSM-associated protein Csm3 (group 7 of RAMP superfamily)